MRTLSEPELSRLFDTTRGGGIGQLIEAELRARGGGDRQGARGCFVNTNMTEVKVLGFGSGDIGGQLHRVDMPLLLSAAAREGDVVIIDGGSILGSASSVELCKLADAVVVAVPLKDRARRRARSGRTSAT